MRYCGVITDISYVNSVIEYAYDNFNAYGTIAFSYINSCNYNIPIEETLEFKFLERCIAIGM